MVALARPGVEVQTRCALQGQRLAIVAHEVLVAAVAVGQKDQVLGVSPLGARGLFYVAVGQGSRGALLAFLIKEQAIRAALLDSHAVYTLNKLRAGGEVGQASGARVGTRINVGRCTVCGGEADQSGHKGDEKELHSRSNNSQVLNDRCPWPGVFI